MSGRIAFLIGFPFGFLFGNLFGKVIGNFDDAGAREVQSLLHGVVPARAISVAPKEEEA